MTMREAWRPEVRLHRHRHNAVDQMTPRWTDHWVSTLLTTLSEGYRYHRLRQPTGGAVDRHAQGILLISLSAVAYSSAGFFTRLIQLDAWACCSGAECSPA
jgi:hypothetical protein